MTARTLRDTWVITKRNLRRYVRLPQLLFFSSMQPVMFLLLFNYVFGGALGMSVHVPGGKYIDYLLPGILVQMVMFGGVQTGIGPADDMGNGIIDRFRSLPMSRVAGRHLRRGPQPDRHHHHAHRRIPARIPLPGRRRVRGGHDRRHHAVRLRHLLGLRPDRYVGERRQTAQLASFVFIFPLTFASSAFVAVQTMPSWLQAFVRNQPVTMVVDAARQLALGIDGYGAVWKVLLWSVALLIVFIPLAMMQYRRRGA